MRGPGAPLYADGAEVAARAQEHLERARAAYRDGHLTPAAESYRAALGLFEAVEDKANQGACLTGLGRVYLDRGDYAAAQSYSERAIRLFSAMGDRRGIGYGLNNLALALSGQGRYSEALAHLQKALHLNQQDGDAEGAAIKYRNIGLVHFYSGQYLEALRDYHNALEIIEANRLAEWSRTQRWLALSSLGAVYKKLGWHEKALRTYLDLLSIPAPDPKSRIYAYNNTGTIYRGLGDPVKAKQYYERALREAVRSENKPAQALVLKNLALVHFLHLQDNQTAADYLTASLALSKERRDRYEEANTYNYLGDVTRRQGQHAGAQVAYEQALAIARGLSFREAQWAALYGLGQLREVKGDLPAARSFYKEAIAAIESARSTLRGESLRTSFLADKMEVYEAGVRSLLSDADRAGNDEGIAKAFEYAERSKARVMLDLLSEATGHIEEGIPSDLRLRMQQLLRELAQRQSAEEEPTAWSKRRQAIERELEAIDLRILESNPRYALVQEPKILTLTEARRELVNPETGLVVFFTGRQSIFAWLITEGPPRILRIPNPASVEANVRTYLRQLTDPTGRDYLSLAAELYDALLGPIVGAVPSTTNRLIIVPDGFLHTLPFETLLAPDKDGRPRHFLIERFEVSYAPSGSVLRALRRIPRHPGEKALLGMSVLDTGEMRNGDDGRPDEMSFGPITGLDRLRYADQELMRIREYVPGIKEIRLRGQSTKSRLQASASHFKVLHFATHSVINEEVPESSFVVLTPDPARNGDAVMWLYEIFNLRLNADLVVLSSCRSGLGKRIVGEGIIGFMRAFMYAGARSVVTTFWEINDQTTPFFMEQFYFHLGRGGRAADALRKAKLKFIESSHYAHPFYWGAFAINGDASAPIYETAPWKRWAPIAGGAVFILIWILISRGVGRKVG